MTREDTGGKQQASGTNLLRRSEANSNEPTVIDQIERMEWSLWIQRMDLLNQLDIEQVARGLLMEYITLTQMKRFSGGRIYARWCLRGDISYSRLGD